MSTTGLPPALKRSWWTTVWLFGAVSTLAYGLVGIAWSSPQAGRWGILTALALVYVLALTRANLRLNRRPAQPAIRARLGAANAVTLARGLLTGLLAGFVVAPDLVGVWALAPGALMTTVSVMDLADGWLARRKRETTDLGAKLDVEVDSLALLVAYILAVKLGQLPLPFMAVGGLYYAYQASLAWRRHRGLPVYPIPVDRRRSVIAGLQMAVLCAILWPVLGPPLTIGLGGATSVLVGLSFGRDWLAATGRLSRLARTS